MSSKSVPQNHSIENFHELKQPHYRTFSNDTEDLILRFNANFKVIYTNPSTETFIGVHHDDFFNKTFRELGYPIGFCDQLENHIIQVFKTGFIQKLSIEFIKDSEKVYIEWMLYPEYQTDNKVITVLAHARDISKYKKVEEIAKQAEIKLQRIVDLVKVGITITDEYGQIIESNKASEKLLGITKNEQLQRNYAGKEWKIVRPDLTHMPAKEFASVRALNEKTTIANVEMGIVKGNEEITWISVTATPLNIPGYGVVITYVDITEQKEKEKQLQMFNRNFDAFLNQTTDFVYFKDIDSRIIFCSKIMAKITGHNDWKELIGKHDKEIFPPDTAKIYTEEEIPIFKEGKPLLNKVNPYYDEFAKLRYVQSNKWPLYNENNQIAGIFGISRDVTEQKKLEQSLKESEEKFRIYFKEDKSVKFLLDPENGKIIDFNQATIDFYGYSEDELNSMYISQINMFPSNKIREVVDDIISKRNNYFKFKHKKASGEIREVELYSTALTINNKIRIFSVIHDITERVMMEDELKASESKYKTLFEFSGSGNVVIDINGVYLSINKKAAEFYGLTPDEIIGKNIFEFHPHEIAEKYFQSNKELIEKGGSRMYEDTFTMNDRQVTFTISDCALKDNNGKYYALQSVSHDISNRKRAELALNESQEELKKFAAHIQHIREEERTYLSRELHDGLGQILIALKMQIGLFKNNFHKTIKGENYELGLEELTKISTTIEDAIKTYRTIMHYLKPTEIQLLGFIESAKIYIANCKEQHNIEYYFETQLSTLQLDSQTTITLYRILQEAITNIHRHSGATKAIIKLHKRNKHLILSIKDNGIGFDTTIHNSDTFGIIGMKERAVLIDADFNIISEPTMPTEIVIQIPYNK